MKENSVSVKIILFSSVVVLKLQIETENVQKELESKRNNSKRSIKKKKKNLQEQRTIWLFDYLLGNKYQIRAC